MYFKFKGKRYLVNKPRRDLKAGTKGNVRQKYLGDSKQQKFFGCFIWTVKQKQKSTTQLLYVRN